MTPAPAEPQPLPDHVARAIKALNEDRLEDARRNAEAIDEAETRARAWKLYLKGRIAFVRGELTSAQCLLERAAALALECGAGGAAEDNDMLRLAADAMNQLGGAHRRQEKLREALRAHDAAYQLRAEHGSADERWESATDAGLDLHLAREYEAARAWYDRAIADGQRALGDPHRKQAQTWGRLSATLLAMGRFREATESARSARAQWLAHDAGCVEGFRAELQVGHGLLMQAQERLETDVASARGLLDDAVLGLATVRDELAAFGAETTEDVDSCDEQLDFGRRLLAMLA